MPLLLLKAFSVPSTPYVIRRQYWTDIITSRKGKEQRRANRVNSRRHIEFSTGIGGTRWVEFNQYMSLMQRQAILIADESRSTVLPTGSVGFNITFDVLPAWIITGMYLVLADFANKTYNYATVGTIAGNVVTLIASAFAYSAGTYVYAGMQGYLLPQIDVANVWGESIHATIAFDEDPQTNVAEPTRTPFASYNGREVWTFPPNKWMDWTNQWTAMMEAVDFGFSSYAQFDIYGRTHKVMHASWTTREDEADQIRALFDRMLGQQGEFYMPTFEKDIVPKTNATAGSNTLVIDGVDFYNLYHGSTIYVCVAVQRSNDRIPTFEYNRITSITVGSTTTTITFATNWAQTVLTTDRISWMPVWRFATDIFEQSWLRGLNKQVGVNQSMPMKMLEDLAGS